jgi:hypothetical protein
MTPETLNRIKEDLGDSTIDQFAKRFDRGRNGMADMLSGKAPIPNDVDLAARALWHRLQPLELG